MSSKIKITVELSSKGPSHQANPPLLGATQIQRFSKWTDSFVRRPFLRYCYLLWSFPRPVSVPMLLLQSPCYGLFSIRTESDWLSRVGRWWPNRKKLFSNPSSEFCNASTFNPVWLNACQVSKELRRLQLENEDLVGKHSKVETLFKRFSGETAHVCKHNFFSNSAFMPSGFFFTQAAQDMQNESIELPNNMDDMQLVLLKFREDIITGKSFFAVTKP